jgi:N-methylhydantoinase A
MPLDASLAAHAVGAVADTLALDLVATASGVHEVVNQNMSAAARMHAVEQGVDLRGVPLLAFGGAGPVHACGVAELLESSRVVFPVNASVLSAFGTLVSPVRIDLARSMVRDLDSIDAAERDAVLAELRAEGRRVLLAAGVPAEAVRFRYGVDVRYAGQGNEVTVWLPTDETNIDAWPATADELRTGFEYEYRRIYGLTIPDVGLQLVTWRLSAVSAAAEFEPTPVAPGIGAEPARRRLVVFDRGQAARDVDVYKRASLGAGDTFAGPAIVEERETTVVIRPGWHVEVAQDGSLIATRSAGSAT